MVILLLPLSKSFDFDERLGQAGSGHGVHLVARACGTGAHVPHRLKVERLLGHAPSLAYSERVDARRHVDPASVAAMLNQSYLHIRISLDIS